MPYALGGAGGALVERWGRAWFLETTSHLRNFQPRKFIWRRMHRNEFWQRPLHFILNSTPEYNIELFIAAKLEIIFMASIDESLRAALMEDPENQVRL